MLAVTKIMYFVLCVLWLLFVTASNVSAFENVTYTNVTTARTTFNETKTVAPSNTAKDDYAVHDAKNRAIDRYVTPFIYLVGFPGNILSFIIWIQKRMRHSSGCYLAALALDDFVFLSLHVVFELHMAWQVHLLNTTMVCQVFPIVFMASQYLGPLLVLGFTTERYISICHPFRREKYCTVRRAKIVIAILVVLAICLSAVQGYFYTMHAGSLNNDTSTSSNDTHQQSMDCGPRPEVSAGGTTSLMLLWNLSIEILTFLLVPLAVLSLNILVIAELRRMSRVESHTLQSHSQRTSATTVMLLAVSFYLILTTLPVTIVYSLFFEFNYENLIHPNGSLINPEDPQNQRVMTYELVLTSIKEYGTTQYAFNIFIYVITGKIFRKELKKLFLRAVCAKFTLSIPKEYSSLKSSVRGSNKTKSVWVSMNGHGDNELRDTEETNV